MPLWIQIVVSVGGIIVAVIAIVPALLDKYPGDETPTPAPLTAVFTPLPVDTDAPDMVPTLQASVEETPLPTPTADASPNFTPAPSSDWFANCIDARIWSPSLAGTVQDQSQPCYQLSVSGISAEDGKLFFVSNTSQSTAVEYGLFTPWENWKQVNFSVQVRELKDSEIWMGVFEQKSLDANGLGFVIQPGDDVDVRQLPLENYPVDNTYLPFASGKYNVTVTLSGGTIKFSVDGQGIISNWPLKFTPNYLFIGYRSLPNTVINASVFNLSFTK
ncbi:MAG: hypothetical protein IT310_06115 [Anaerolineales bacterium]|nr:hypothetical protein [Anaerolineales bacterium]